MSPTLSDISSIMKDESPVFIVGAARSGTSILYRTLQKHSSFKPQNCTDSSGVELTESNIFKQPYSTYAGANSDAFAYLLKDDNSYRQFIEATQAIQNYQKLLVGKEIFQKATPLIPVLRGSVWKLTQNDTLIRTFLHYAKQARGVYRILEKTPQHIYWLPEIKETFPKAKLLFMPRHPVDVFSSYQRRLKDSIKLGMNESEIKWLKISPQSFCNKYSFYMHLALKEKTSNPNGFMVVRYEDFTSHPKSTLQHIFDFVGENYEEECIPEEKKEKTGWKSDSNLFGGIKSSTKSWQDYTAETDAKFLEDRLSKIMRQFDYPRYT